jgi:broad specificity phosphatase PhoE
MIVFYLTHAQVDVEPSRPVPLWRLSERGRGRINAVRNAAWLRTVTRLISSAETKAVETAAMLAEQLGIPLEVHAQMGENDRSSTGFLEPQQFEAAADRFFADPHVSWNGWERAVDAADRIETAVRHALSEKPSSGPVLLVGHGAVGTLLKCRIGGRALARSEDQPHGGGNVFAFDLAAGKILCDWTAIEDFDVEFAHS